ncbi:MAG: DUF368 domain-containing protein, partial [Pseudomonadota bacterium]
MSILTNLLRGVVIGLANIIPGVSGGTMALILGIYARLIAAVHNLGFRTIKSFFGGRRALLAELKRVDALFLATIGVGAVATIVAVAKLLMYLLHHHHDQTYGFFFGLVLASVVVPFKMIRKKSLSGLLACVLAVVAVLVLTIGISKEDRLASAQKKAAIAAAKAATSSPTENKIKEIPSDMKTMLIFFVAGAIAISAMILPGISGSLMLLLMGVYFDIMACITNRQFVLLGIFALGCLLGLLAFSRILNFFLEK